MTAQSNQNEPKTQNHNGIRNEGRSRLTVAIIASLFLFCLTFMALWALTTLGFVYAIATATPMTIIVACSIYMVDAVGECFATIVEAIASIFAAIMEAIGAVIAAILAALAAVFSIFGS